MRMQGEIVAHDADIVKHLRGLDVRLPQHFDLDAVRLLEALPRPGEILFFASDLSYPAVAIGDGEEVCNKDAASSMRPHAGSRRGACRAAYHTNAAVSSPMSWVTPSRQ